MKYMIEETYTRTYLVHADSMDDAIEAAFEIDDSWEYEESCQGFTYILEVETNKDRLL